MKRKPFLNNRTLLSRNQTLYRSKTRGQFLDYNNVKKGRNSKTLERGEEVLPFEGKSWPTFDDYLKA
ncbi:hypothetical protein CDL12_29668 [Handroanthus impetiginosus]|uniref:Uncharacterized protein n=1 Tax=Handroanthus impetiginosus TaxID=429701 RepID=A0A2G9FYX1_9LAMI|nr:hypothetical protein CDL12_29668 [Handroanthus impetiginosus]